MEKSIARKDTIKKREKDKGKEIEVNQSLKVYQDILPLKGNKYYKVIRAYLEL
jgi:hypothetical protein